MLLNISRNVIESAPSTTWSQYASACCWRRTPSASSARAPVVVAQALRDRRAGPGRGELGDLGSDVQPGLEDRPGHRQVELAAGDQQARSRSRPPRRRKSRTVVEPPWRTSTRPAVARRCRASRTAGRETPSTSASRRSLGSGSPGPRSPPVTSATQLVEDVVGNGAALHGAEGHAVDGRRRSPGGQVVIPVQLGPEGAGGAAGCGSEALRHGDRALARSAGGRLRRNLGSSAGNHPRSPP